MSLFPRLVFVVGAALFLAAVSQGVLTIRSGRGAYVALLDFVFVGTPGVALAYAGLWLPDSDIAREHYPRITGRVLAGVLLMYGFIVLRDLHPGVTVEWSIGTQAIALTIGSIGGLLIGIQEARARTRTEQLESRTRELKKREAELERQNEQLEQFASVLSHDLRNPLSVAQGHLELARDRSDSEHLETVADAHDRMVALIDDLLTLA
jgi:signal transduction histidine kinase